MTSKTIYDCIQAAVRACTEKDARAFASLFLPEGEMVLRNDRIVGRDEIARVSAKYLATCEAIAIEVRRILVDGDCAVVEWTWQDAKRGNGQRNVADNAIVIDFKEGAIARWREYRS
ncbi:MAG: nuclear transport factor 2 family protein [Cyanobacteriota bacterium]|nr:nuclear transport factor 2 family protein [Cyanobacteriota bacterium]